MYKNVDIWLDHLFMFYFASLNWNIKKKKKVFQRSVSKRIITCIFFSEFYGFFSHFEALLYFLQILNHAYISRISPTWSWFMIPYILLSLICLYFGQYIYTYQRNWFVIFFSLFLLYFSSFWYQNNGFIEWLWEGSSIFIFLKYFEKDKWVAQWLKYLPAVWETWVWSLGWEDPLEKEMATHSSILAWRIPWTKEPGGLQSLGSQRVRHDWATSLYFTSLHTFSNWRHIVQYQFYHL